MQKQHVERLGEEHIRILLEQVSEVVREIDKCLGTRLRRD